MPNIEDTKNGLLSAPHLAHKDFPMRVAPAPAIAPAVVVEEEAPKSKPRKESK